MLERIKDIKELLPAVITILVVAASLSFASGSKDARLTAVEHTYTSLAGEMDSLKGEIIQLRLEMEHERALREAERELGRK